jgi:hypothetical protein
LGSGEPRLGRRPVLAARVLQRSHWLGQPWQRPSAGAEGADLVGVEPLAGHKPKDIHDCHEMGECPRIRQERGAVIAVLGQAC